MSNVYINPEAVCSDCGMGAQLECTACGENFTNACQCVQDLDVDEVVVYCHTCGLSHEVVIDDLFNNGDAYNSVLYDGGEEHRDNNADSTWADDDEWECDDDARYDDWWNRQGSGGHKTYHTVSTCRHYNFPVPIGEATVYASSSHTRDYGEAAPDFGLYLDTVWKPACLAYQVEWKDYGLPEYLDVAARAIIDAYNKALRGLWVEVGCIGGHGRTGTVLSCMAVLAGMEPVDAIKYVRGVYCTKAVESKSQIWFVEWFHTFINGGKIDDYDDEWEYSFDSRFHWEDFDVEDFPQGAPPDDIIVLSKGHSYKVEDKKPAGVSSGSISTEQLKIDYGANTETDDDDDLPTFTFNEKPYEADKEPPF